MNTFLIKSAPPERYHEVSIEAPQWREDFRRLASERQNIMYHVAQMPTLPKDIEQVLSDNGYTVQILNENMRFLTPKRV